MERDSLDGEKLLNYLKIYPNEDVAKFAHAKVMELNDALALREQNSIVFNGIPYSLAYEYNRRKAINYAPPKNPKDDKEVSFGLPHEKIIAFSALFLKYAFKRTTKCRDENGAICTGMGKVYDLAIEHSFRLEKFNNLIGLAYWEMFSQGNAFIFDDWEVMDKCDMVPMYKGKPVGADEMDYTYEFLDHLTYKKGKEYQTRRAVSRLLDGRNIIFKNPEINDVQDQPTIWLEYEMSRSDMKSMCGTLKQWANVPKDFNSINHYTPSKITLFNTERLAKPESRGIMHLMFDRETNHYNIFCNGIMMLPMETPFTLFYPRGNYPITNIPCERLTGSIYARGIPAKTKFNADFIDWALKMLAYKFEQGAFPAILAKGRYTLTKDIFRGGQVTHGVQKSDYEKADPDNKGATTNDISFVEMLKEIVENQTVSATGAGDLSSNPTAEEVATLDQNQREKLAYMLDGMVNGFTDLYMRRAETIESKYTIKQKETVVDGKKVNVFQNFTVSISGVDHSVAFDDNMGAEGTNTKAVSYQLFQKSFKMKKEGSPTEYHLVDPALLRDRRFTLDIEVQPEKIKDTAIQLQGLWSEFTELLQIFGTSVNMEDLKKIYLETSNRPDTIFQPAALAAAQGGGLSPILGGQSPTTGQNWQPQGQGQAMQLNPSPGGSAPARPSPRMGSKSKAAVMGRH